MILWKISCHVSPLRQKNHLGMPNHGYRVLAITGSHFALLSRTNVYWAFLSNWEPISFNLFREYAHPSLYHAIANRFTTGYFITFVHDDIDIQQPCDKTLAYRARLNKSDLVDIALLILMGWVAATTPTGCSHVAVVLLQLAHMQYRYADFCSIVRRAQILAPPTKWKRWAAFEAGTRITQEPWAVSLIEPFQQASIRR